jgi:pimeloyl-ACP methyl ester carboxylesterase
VQRSSFVHSRDGTRIAVASLGEGPVILRAAHWLSHVSHDLQSPVWRPWLETLSRNHRLVRYDLRGCGLSEREVLRVGFDAWLEDLEAVSEGLGNDLTLFGMSQGGALSIAFALRYPERVSRLILFGAYGRGTLVRARTQAERIEAETLVSLMKLGWGTDDPGFDSIFTRLFIPDGTPEQHDWWRQLERDTAAPDTAARSLEALHRINVMDMAAQLRVPTLVFHARGDARIPFSEGEALAEAIPGAELVPLESKNHVILGHEPAWQVFEQRLTAFLSEGSDASPGR